MIHKLVASVEPGAGGFVHARCHVTADTEAEAVAMTGAFLKLTRGDRLTLMREGPSCGSFTSYDHMQRRFQASVRFSVRDEPGEIKYPKPVGDGIKYLMLPALAPGVDRSDMCA